MSFYYDFTELKEAEITRERLTTLREVDEHIGTYYSKEAAKAAAKASAEAEEAAKVAAKEAAEAPAAEAPDEDGDSQNQSNTDPRDSKVVNG